MDDDAGAGTQTDLAVSRELIQHEESLRREFVDDLLRGDANVARLVGRAQTFGLDLSRPHRVLLGEHLAGSRPEVGRAAGRVERAVVDRYGDREVLVATKDDLLVVILPGEAAPADIAADQVGAAALLRDQLLRHTGSRDWRVAAGRPHPGAYGIAGSYEEAREALGLARRLGLTEPLLPRHLLLYRVIGRDQAALVDLVHGVLGPLTSARGGAEPLLATLETFFATGGVATETARLLHLSVRAVTYRLARIAALTGVDPTDPAESLALHVGVLGARLLGWPDDS